MSMSRHTITLLRARVLEVLCYTLRFDGQMSFVTFRILDKTRMYNYICSVNTFSYGNLLECKGSTCSSCILYKISCFPDKFDDTVRFMGVIGKDIRNEFLELASSSLYCKIYYNHHEV